MRVLAQLGERLDVPYRFESRGSGLAVWNSPIFLVCCSKIARNGEPNTPSRARESGALFGGESTQVNNYASCATAALLIVRERGSGRWAPTTTSPMPIGTNVLRSLSRDAGLDHQVNIDCSIRFFSIIVVAPVHLETQIHYVSSAVVLAPSGLFCVPTACTTNIP